ncbi:hypothetical protein AAG906_030194 [Vitis piasezkii]
MPFLHQHSILINHLAGSGEVCKEEVRNMSRGAIIGRHQLSMVMHEAAGVILLDLENQQRVRDPPSALLLSISLAHKDGAQKPNPRSMGTATSPFPQPHRLTSILVDAIEVGYRHFDTAAHYRLWPEASLRVEVKCSSLQSYGARTTALTSFFHKLGMEYVDLYLVHWPVRLRNEAPDKGFRGGGCCSIGHEKGHGRP